jgi:hypothetical protein
MLVQTLGTPSPVLRSRSWTGGFVLRLVTVCVGFLALVYFAGDSLARAIQHRGYYFSYRGSTGFGSSSAPPPSLGDAA